MAAEERERLLPSLASLSENVQDLWVPVRVPRRDATTMVLARFVSSSLGGQICAHVQSALEFHREFVAQSRPVILTGERVHLAQI